MRKIINYILCTVLFVSCNRYSDSFFEFLFNSKNIQINRICADNPSILSEGRYFEIYSMSSVNSSLVISNILRKSSFSKSKKYPAYRIPEWKRTPVYSDNDAAFAFIHLEMSEKKNNCYNETEVINILKQRNNYFTFLNDDLGSMKLFIWDTKNQKLYLLSSYEL